MIDRLRTSPVANLSLPVLATLLLSALLPGCVQGGAPNGRDASFRVLDNHGGVSHAGRRIVLRPDGTYTESLYTDVVGDEQTKRGVYNEPSKGKQLTLSPEGGPPEHLYRVDYQRRQYWVHEQDSQRITQPSQSRLRGESLQTKVP